MPPSEDNAEADEEFTSSNEVRWRGLATAVAGLTVFTFLLIVVLAALGVVSLASIGGAWATLFGVVVTAAYAYALGEEYVRRRGE